MPESCPRSPESGGWVAGVGAFVVTLFRTGKVWWLRYRVDGRKVRETLKTENRKLAEELRARRQHELLSARLAPAGVAIERAPVVVVAPPPPVVAVAQAREEYAAWSTVHKRPKTILNDNGRLDEFFASVPGKALDAITTADVERMLTQLARRGCAPATILRQREILHAFWRWCGRQGHVPRNIVEGVPRPRLPERDPRFLSLAQIDELLRAVEGDAIAPLVATAVFAGLRREELCWLTWEDLTLGETPALLRVRAKTVDGASWQPKTKRNRVVPLGSRLREGIDRHAASARPARVTWVFPSPEGHRWDPDNLGRRLRALMERASLPWNFLDLRHTFGSQLARKGVSLLKIAKLMGNSPAIASRHYIHLVAEEMAVDVEF